MGAGLGGPSVGGGSSAELPVVVVEGVVAVVAEGGEVGFVGGAVVGVPFVDVVVFAAVHGFAAQHAAAVAYGDGELLWGAGVAAAASVPQHLSGSAEDGAADAGVG